VYDIVNVSGRGPCRIILLEGLRSSDIWYAFSESTGLVQCVYVESTIGIERISRRCKCGNDVEYQPPYDSEPDTNTPAYCGGYQCECGNTLECGR